MDVVGIADVDGDGEPALRIFGRNPPLRLAHLRPAAVGRRNRWLAITGQLHQQQGQACAELPPPVVAQRTQAQRIRRALAGVRFSLIPEHAAQPDAAERRDHPVVQRRQPGGGLPGGKWRRLLARRHPVLPRRLQYHPLTVVEPQAVCRRGARQATFAVGVEHVDRNAVQACLQQAAGQRVAPLAGAVLAAHGNAVHPGHVRLVGRSQLQGRAACSLSSAQHHLRSIPDHAVVVGKRGHVPPLPRPQRRRCARPSAVIGVRAPGRVAGQRALTRGPPVLPVAAPGCACRQRITRGPREDIKGLVHAALPSKCIGTGPGLDPRAAPRRLDQPHRHVDRALQLAGEVEAGCREVADRIGRCRRPCDTTIEMRLCLHGRGVRHSEQPDAWDRGRGDLAGCVERAPHRKFHVRLARAQPDVADQHIAH